VTDIQLVAYEPGDKDAYVGLLQAAWGEQGLNRAEFEWWFERNPEGSIMSVARIGEQVVGAGGFSLFRMVLDGEQRTAGFALHATTHESARGRGIFTQLQAKNEQEARDRGVAVALGFGNSVTNPTFFGRLGWTDIGHYRMWARPLLRANAFEILQQTVATSLTTDGDAAAAWRNHVIRDQRYLAWRYVDSPRPYQVIDSESGYAVLGRRAGTPVISDLVAPRSKIRDLLRSAIRSAQGRLLVAVPAPDERSTFLTLGFVPTHRSLHLIGKALTGRLNTDPRAWRFTLGDADFF
jgi:GNAT superfamily N-acetyltransferase